jgi:hypothetical protein
LHQGLWMHVQLSAGRQTGVNMKITIKNFQHRFSLLEP